MKKLLMIIGVIIAGVLFWSFSGEKKQLVKESLKKELFKHEEIIEPKLPVGRGRAFLTQKVKKDTIVNNKVEVTQEEATNTIKKIRDGFKEINPEKFDEYFERITSGWEQRMSVFFLKELALGQEELTSYYELKNQFENERVEMFKEFHRNKAAGSNENYRFDLTSEELKNDIDTLKEEYQEKLRDKIGEDAYKKYLLEKGRYNNDNKGRIGPGVSIDY